ncbi:hypothetical protein KJ815_11840, partial [bacterium]|nr:hypothetical protein [bacterium]
LIQQAMEQFGATDAVAFKAEAKKRGCLFERAGIAMVDVEKFRSVIDAEFERMAESASTAKSRTRRASSDLGLLMARLAQYEGRKARKLARIANIREAISNAATAYERQKLTSQMARLEAEAQRLDAGEAADEKRRDEILNGDSSVREAA